MGRPETVDEYLAGFDNLRAARLREIRRLSVSAAPGAQETLKWGVPAYVDDTILFQFAGYKAHTNIVVTPSTKEALDGWFGEFETGKGSLKIPHTADLPVDLIRRLLDHRVREWTVDRVRWM